MVEEISQIDVQKIKDYKKESLKFDPSLFEKVTGIKIENSEIEKILNNLDLKLKKSKNHLN